MSLIDSTYFIREISLPVGANSNIDSMISRYEPEILKMLLGYELYELMIATPLDVRFDRLINGYEYDVEYNNRTTKVKWNGLVNDDKISLIAYYVYYRIMRDENTFTGSVGEFKPIQENSSNANPSLKMKTAYNLGVDLYGGFYDHYLLGSELQPTAYNFLTKFKDDYPEWIFTCMEKINSFNL